MFSAFDITQFAMLVVVFLLYILAGQFAWHRLCQHAATDEEIAVVSGSYTVPAMIFGRWIMVLTWPFWAVVPAIIRAGVSMFRPTQVGFD